MTTKSEEKTVTTITLKDIMSSNPNLSLKRVSEVTNTCYQYLLKASKKPIKGQIYDPNAVNFDEVERLIRNKIKLEEIDWHDVVSSIQIREPAASLKDFDDESVYFSLRNDDGVYQIVYRTETHLVFIAKNSTVPRVMNNETFLHQGPKIVKVEQ